MKRPNIGFLGMLGHTLMFVLIFVVLLTLSYLVLDRLFPVLSSASQIPLVIVSGLVALCCTLFTGWLLAAVRLRRIGHPDPRKAQDLIVDALGQIAQGNFDVSVSIEKWDFYEGIAAKINDMAKNLGSLETMRQDFITDVSHEIQSPLTSIAGFAAILKHEGISSEQRKHYAAIIESESKRISKLSDNLLRLSSLESNKTPLELREYRLDKQLKTCVLALEPQWMQKDISLEMDVSPQSYHGNEDLLSQVWINLIGNAIKFTPEGGTVAINLHERQDEEKRFMIVEIADTGIGISAADQIHVFERFYKVDEARDRDMEGNGLGLSLVKKIVDMHGGHIEIESTPGKGSVFRVVLESSHQISP